MKLAIIGFGTVGQGLIRILQKSADDLKTNHGLDAQVVAISDAAKGSVYHPDGLDLQELAALGSERGALDKYLNSPGLIRSWDSLATIRESNADVVVEATWTDLKTGEPALGHMRAAFESGKHVITTNKGPLVFAYKELSRLAASKRLYFGFEGTVMSGTPAIQMGRVALAGCEIQEMRGILNGTTNYILTQMETGKSFGEALAEAQRMGYAEADPSADIQGRDAQAKAIILANALLQADLRPNDVPCQGIDTLTAAQIHDAHAAGQRWKLIASVRRNAGKIEAAVQPTRLPVSDPLASIAGVTNAISFQTDLLGPVTLIGPGAGQKETGFALLSDLLTLARSTGATVRAA